MISLKIVRQKLSINKPYVVADSRFYLRLKASFSSDWDGIIKHVDFDDGTNVYQMLLDSDDEIKPEAGLNLTKGKWTVSVHGIDADGNKRITTNTVRLDVYPTGNEGEEPFPTLPPSLGEQYVSEMKKLLEEAGNRPCVLG